MINGGVFKGVDAAMMVHPYGPSNPGFPNLLDMNFLCLDVLVLSNNISLISISILVTVVNGHTYSQHYLHCTV